MSYCSRSYPRNWFAPETALSCSFRRYPRNWLAAEVSAVAKVAVCSKTVGTLLWQGMRRCLNKECSIRCFGRKPKPFQPRRNSSCLRTFQTHTKHPFRSNSLHRQKMTCTSPCRGPDETRLPRTICDIDTPYSFCYIFRTHLHIARSHTLRDFHREDRIQWHRRFCSSV